MDFTGIVEKDFKLQGKEYHKGEQVIVCKWYEGGCTIWRGDIGLCKDVNEAWLNVSTYIGKEGNLIKILAD